MNFNIVIGIGGQKHSGKDTFASMLIYINKVGPAAANYSAWYELYKNQSIDAKLKTVHFADSLKDVCSIMFNIDRKLFDNLEYKDNKYYSFRENKFINEIDITIDKQRLVPTDLINFNNFKTIIADNPNAPLIKIRNLMTVFADTMKYVFGENVFVNNAIRKIDHVVEMFKFCIVPDVRFNNEVVALKQTEDYWQGYVIKLIRPAATETKNLHNSEVCDFNADYIIYNDSNLFKLFYKAIDVYNKIIKEANYKESIKKEILNIKTNK